MKKIPWKGISIGCFALVLLIVARCVVTVGKSFYFGMDWVVELMEDTWFYVGILVAAVGMGALIAMAVQNRKNSRIEE